MVDLEAINAAHQAATQGEWDVAWEDGKHGVIASVGDYVYLVAVIGNPNPTDGREPTRKANAHLVAVLHNAWPAVYAEMLALRDKVAELEELLEDAKNQRDGALYFMERNDIRNEDEVSARDARMRREGAVEAFSEMRRQAEDVGQQSGLAKKMCKIFADECIEQAEQRLKGGE